MEKRVFFAFDVAAPWPETYPQGRILAPENRHLTLAFLGNTDVNTLLPPPTPEFTVGLVGKFDQCLFFPPRSPRVVAWSIAWLEDAAPFSAYLTKLLTWLNHEQTRSFLPHVTLSRGTFQEKAWRSAFTPLPLMLTALHLYESLGNSTYNSLWNHPLTLPLEEIDHTGDIGYLIRGTTLPNLYAHAQVALAFSFPPILPFLTEAPSLTSLEDMIIALNTIVSAADQAIGCPYKAVSFHGSLQETQGLIEWEMIIDV